MMSQEESELVELESQAAWCRGGASSTAPVPQKKYIPPAASVRGGSLLSGGNDEEHQGRTSFDSRNTNTSSTADPNSKRGMNNREYTREEEEEERNPLVVLLSPDEQSSDIYVEEDQGINADSPLLSPSGIQGQQLHHHRQGFNTAAQEDLRRLKKYQRYVPRFILQKPCCTLKRKQL